MTPMSDVLKGQECKDLVHDIIDLVRSKTDRLHLAACALEMAFVLTTVVGKKDGTSWNTLADRSSESIYNFYEILSDHQEMQEEYLDDYAKTLKKYQKRS